VKPAPHTERDYRRLARRNLASLLRYKFLYEYGYDKGPVVVEAIVADLCELIRRWVLRPGDLEPGQLVYPAPAATEGASKGKTIARTKLLPVRLTLVASEDLEAIRAGRPAAERRAIRVRRLAQEAHGQGALVSQTDVALLLGCSQKTVSNLVMAFRQRGELLPLRGYLADMGRYPTHKAAVVRLYLQGLTTPDIAARTAHSKQAVDRYIQGFERLRLLAGTYAREELPLLTGMSQGLIEQYLGLLDEHGLTPAAPKEVRRRALS
jgi:transposase